MDKKEIKAILKEHKGRTLYVITRGEYSDYRIECIFEDKEKAENYVKYHQDSWEDCRIEEYNLEDENYKLVTNGYYKVNGEIVIDKTGLIKDLRTWDKDCLTNTPETYSSLFDDGWSDNSGNWHLRIIRSFPEFSVHCEEELEEKLVHILKDIAVQVASLRVQGFDIDYVKQMLKKELE